MKYIYKLDGLNKKFNHAKTIKCKHCVNYPKNSSKKIVFFVLFFIETKIYLGKLNTEGGEKSHGYTSF